MLPARNTIPSVLFLLTVCQWQTPAIAQAATRPASVISPTTASATAPASGPAYAAPVGPHAVITSDATWQDKARGREVPVRIYAPDANTAAGPLPAIVISHGLGGSRVGYAYLARHLAGHGYLCVVPTHLGSDTSILLGGGWGSLLNALGDANNLVLRPGDVSFVIGRMTAPDAPAVLKGRVDANRIGVAGHSFGAYTALAVAGQTIRTGDGNERGFGDERVKAAIAMSPQGPGRIGLSEKSWDAVRIPVMIMTGSRDYSLGGSLDVRSRRYAFDHMPPGEKYLLWIEYASHLAFSDNDRNPMDLGQFIQRDPRHHPWILAAATAFFDACLKGDAKARDWLRQGQIEKVSDGQAKLERRPKNGGQ